MADISDYIRAKLDRFKARLNPPIIDVVSRNPNVLQSARARATLPQAQRLIQQAREAPKFSIKRPQIQPAIQRFQRGYKEAPKIVPATYKFATPAIARFKRGYQQATVEPTPKVRPRDVLRELGSLPRGLMPQYATREEAWRNMAIPLTTDSSGRVTRAIDMFGAVGGIKSVGKGKAARAMAEKLSIQLDVLDDVLKQHPARGLAKYMSKRGDFAGGLREVTGKAKAKFARMGDDIADELGFADTEQARQAFSEYRELQAQRKQYADKLRELGGRAVARIKKPAIQKMSTAEIETEMRSIAPDIDRTNFAEATKGLSKSQQARIEKLRVALTKKLPVAIERAREVTAPRIRLQRQAPRTVKAPIDRLSQRIPTLESEVRVSKDITARDKVNIIDYLRTPTRVLEKIGLGKEGRALQQGWEAYKKELPGHIEQISNWLNRLGTSESQLRVFKALDGQAVRLNTAEAEVASEIRSMLVTWADRLGLPQEKRITNYIARIFPQGSREFDIDIARMITGKVAGSVYNPFLLKRLGAQGYRENLGLALQAYVKRAARKVNMDPSLAQIKKVSKGLEISQYKYVAKLTDRINLRPTQIDQLIDNTIRSLPGGTRLVRPTMQLGRVARMWGYRGTLGLNVTSAIRNLTQGVNTFAKLGTRHTVSGYIKIARQMATRNLDEMKQMNVLEDRFIDKNISVFKKNLQRVDEGLWIFFDTAEKINRGAAYYGAKAKALARGATEKQAMKEGAEMARVTQFKFGPTDIPPILQSDIGKILLQFQSYNIKQVEFLADMLVKKEYAALMRYGIGAFAVTATIGKLIGVEPQDWIPYLQDLREPGRTRIGRTPAIQLAGTALQAGLRAEDKYGRKIGAGEVGTAMIPFIPAGVQTKRTIQGIGAYRQGYSATDKGLLRYPIKKGVGSAIRTAILGQYAAPEAREYFKEDRRPLSEKQTELVKQNIGLYGKILTQREKNKELNEAKELVKENNQPQVIDDKIIYWSGEKVSTIDIGKVISMPRQSKADKIKYEKAVYGMASKALNNKQIKQQVLSRLGVSESDAQYYQDASRPDDEQLAIILDMLDTDDSTSLLETLTSIRRKVGGKMLLTDTLVGKLVTEGIISKDTGKYLKSFEVGKDSTLKFRPTTLKAKKPKKPKKLTIGKISTAKKAPAFKKRKARKKIKLLKVKVPPPVRIKAKTPKTVTLEQFRKSLESRR